MAGLWWHKSLNPTIERPAWSKNKFQNNQATQRTLTQMPPPQKQWEFVNIYFFQLKNYYMSMCTAVYATVHIWPENFVESILLIPFYLYMAARD